MELAGSNTRWVNGPQGRPRRTEPNAALIRDIASARSRLQHLELELDTRRRLAPSPSSAVRSSAESPLFVLVCNLLIGALLFLPILLGIAALVRRLVQ